MKELTNVGAVNLALRHALQSDSQVMMLGEDIAHFGGMFRVTEGLLNEFGESRVIDTPISESGFLGMGLGAALAGKKPVVELMFNDFSLVAMDQILNNIAKTHLMSGGNCSVPLTILTQGGGYKGAAAQHSQMLEVLFLHLPGIKVVCPGNPADSYALTRAAIDDPNPVLVMQHKQLFGVKGLVDETAKATTIGIARKIRSGKELTVISYSYSLKLCEQAIESGSIDADLIDLRSLNPLDFETIAESVRKTHRVLIVHESHARCGVGVDLAYRIQNELFDELDAPVQVHGAADVPIPFAESLENLVLPTIQSVSNSIQAVLK